MKINFFKRFSLCTRITLISIIILTSISVLLTIPVVYNAENIIKKPINKLNSTDFNEISDTNYETMIETSKLSNVIINFKLHSYMYMIALIFLGAFFIYYILKKEFASLKKLSDEMTLINENKLSHKITGFDNGYELTLFANSFNTMLNRLDKAFESQKRFSVDASHELKTPLTVLKTNLDVLNLIENPSEEDYKYTISIFKKQTERMIDLVDSLFLTAFQKDYDLNDTIVIDNIISNIIHDLEDNITEKNISIDVTKSDIVTKGNCIMLTHAISNVVQNAVKYNKPNGSISVTFEKIEKNYIIKIEDTGIGIPKDKENDIFEPFFRVDESRSRKSSGAGLGLAITKEVIYRHGGKITYTPNKDGGSIFKIKLPFII
ncbi:hypothetical protein VN21_08680 [Paraclostridium benzoelyticum]|uniref:histidine kinase n=1 Tax=Paraclostridium benzoelyticum TaxID=1629550 RepID=A0A0M3DH87_9FIRM|nr:HAMP domain-containing sensor histidine kinase [Paraclostridium benzoelyticum]KKY01491.1 hypothetical protein VN21_08680 [Paraclostridium benzoelyticum]